MLNDMFAVPNALAIERLVSRLLHRSTPSARDHTPPVKGKRRFPLDPSGPPGVTSENAREPEQVVPLGRLLLILAQKNSGREPRKARAMLSGSHGKQMPREIAMESDIRQAIDGFVMSRAPRPLRLQAGNGGIQDGKLIHQLAGSLDQCLRLRAVAHRRLIRAGKQRPVVLQPSQRVWWSVAVPEDARSAAGLSTDRRWQWFGDNGVTIQGLQVSSKSTQVCQSCGGGDDDGGRTDSARCCRHRDLFPACPDSADR